MKTDDRDVSRLLRLQQADDRLPRHVKRGRLSLHVRGAPIRHRIRHRAARRRSFHHLCFCFDNREQGRDRARQGRVGSEGGAEKKGQGKRKERRRRGEGEGGDGDGWRREEE